MSGNAAIFGRNSSGYRRFRQLRGRLKSAVALLYARHKRKRTRATYIAVTGSSAKTTTVALLAHILSAHRRVKAQVHRNGLGDACRTIAGVSPGDEFVALELGTAAPGEMERVASLVKPSIAIVTLVALEHYSAFRSKEAIAAEKGALIRALPRDGLAFLNSDDPLVLSMAKLTPARVVTFGQSGADYCVDGVTSAVPGELAFTLNHRDRRLPLKTRLTGAHNWLAVSAAAACALELGVPEAIVSERVADFEPLFGRLSVHECEAGPTFILDTAKAPYHSLPLVLSVLRDCPAPRKRFVLGDISDYSGTPKPKFRDAYLAARTVADQVLFVGTAAKRYRASGEDIENGKFASFESIAELSAYIKASAIPGEVILVKSSGFLHLERLMIDWSAGVKCWPDMCGKRGVSCIDCGLYGAPFSQHQGRRARLKVAASPS